MGLPSYHNSGTASVANGATLVTFAGAGLGTVEFPFIEAGDMFLDLAQPLVPEQRIASVNYAAQTVTLAVGWPGATLASAPYEIRLTDDAVRRTAQQRRYIEMLGQLGALGIQPNAFGQFSDRAAYNAEAAGFIFLSLNGDGALNTAWTLYARVTATAGTWDSGQPMEGAKGDPGNSGWSPVHGYVPDGARMVAQLVGYVGGGGTAPTADIGKYVGAAGYTVAIGDAVALPPGANGLDGTNGTDPGVLLTFDTGTADADPGAGTVRANNASLAAANMLFISKTNRAGSSIASFLLGLAGSTNADKGGFTLTNPADNKQALLRVTGITDATGYVKVAVSGHSGETTFADAVPLSLQFDRTGNKGADGTGTGDMVGPAVATNNSLARFDGTSGKLLKDGLTVGIGANNIPQLDGSGLLDTSILPAIAVTDVFTVASQAAMLALTAQRGDIAIRSDLNKSFALATNSPGTLADWKELLTPTDVVLAVAGLTGSISAAALKTALAIAVGDITDASPNGRSFISASNYAAMTALLTDASLTAKGVVELATAAEYRAGSDSTRALNTAEVWDGADLAVLTDAATIAIDFALGLHFGAAANAPLPLGGNRELGAPSNVNKNQAGIVWFTASGATRTLTLNAAWKLGTGVPAGPYSITTAEELGVVYVTRGSVVTVSTILRKAV